jgi:23S rRNA (uracil1939-C5)-methyltransferase
VDIKKGDTVELRIEKVVYGGSGLAHLHKMAIFVDRAVPGDRVAARVVRRKKNYAEARIVELREASPHRVSPPCAYWDQCGGCTWQFVRYEKQLEYKQDFVEDLMTHMAKLKNVRLHHVLPSPDIYGYRNKMEFSFSDRKWIAPGERREQGGEPHCALGLHVPGTFDKIIDIEGCLLQADRGNEILREVKGYVRESGIPAYGLRSHQGFWRYLVLRHSHCFDEWMVNIVTSDERGEPLKGMASMLRDRFREIVSIVNNINTRRGGTAVGEWQRNLLGDGYIREGIGPLTFQVSAGSFFQANTPLSQHLYRAVRDFASLTGRETVLDLYCGIGTVSACLASQASRILGMDISESAIADARRNCQLNGIDNCEFQCGDVKSLLSRVTSTPQVLITDPPRAGMHKKVIEHILHVMPERIVYISCNPATLARDIVSLKEGYQVEEVQPIDLFPHTYHIEAIARLERKRG